MGTSYYIVDTVATADYSANTYYQIYVDSTASLEYKGVTYYLKYFFSFLNIF